MKPAFSKMPLKNFWNAAAAHRRPYKALRRIQTCPGRSFFWAGAWTSALSSIGECMKATEKSPVATATLISTAKIKSVLTASGPGVPACNRWSGPPSRNYRTTYLARTAPSLRLRHHLADQTFSPFSG